MSYAHLVKLEVRLCLISTLFILIRFTRLFAKRLFILFLKVSIHSNFAPYTKKNKGIRQLCLLLAFEQNFTLWWYHSYRVAFGFRNQRLLC